MSAAGKRCESVSIACCAAGAATSAPARIMSRTASSTPMSTTACAISSSDVTRCLSEASDRSACKRSSATSASCECAIVAEPTSSREPVAKPVGKPDAGNPHVRFDERGRETEPLAMPQRHRALPRLYKTLGFSLELTLISLSESSLFKGLRGPLGPFFLSAPFSPVWAPPRARPTVVRSNMPASLNAPPTGGLF